VPAGEGDQAHFKPITTGIIDTDRIEIASGLIEGDRVVTTGAAALRHGDRIILAGGQVGGRGGRRGEDGQRANGQRRGRS
jgi:hypothetical protein